MGRNHSSQVTILPSSVMIHTMVTKIWFQFAFCKTISKGHVALWVRVPKGKSSLFCLVCWPQAGSGDVMVLLCHRIQQDCLIKVSCDLVGGNLSQLVTMLPIFVSIGILLFQCLKSKIPQACLNLSLLCNFKAHGMSC